MGVIIKNHFREHFISNGEFTKYSVYKTIKDAITIHKEKYETKYHDKILQTLYYGAVNIILVLEKQSYDSILKYHLTLYDAHI